MIKRLLWLLVLLLLFASTFSEAQETAKIPRIGYLGGGSYAANLTRLQAFRQGLREAGYVEEKNIVIEYRYAEGKRDRVPAFAAELVRLKVDVIVTTGPTATRPAKEATSTIPIVMAQDDDPVGSGFVASLARPGRNITGLSTLSPELSGKRLELLKEAVPKLARVAVLYDPANPNSVRELKEVLPVAARALRVTIEPWEVRGADGFERVFAALSKQRPDGLYVLGGSPLMVTNQKRISGLEPVTVDVRQEGFCRGRGRLH